MQCLWRMETSEEDKVVGFWDGDLSQDVQEGW